MSRQLQSVLLLGCALIVWLEGPRALRSVQVVWHGVYGTSAAQFGDLSAATGELSNPVSEAVASNRNQSRGQRDGAAAHVSTQAAAGGSDVLVSARTDVKPSLKAAAGPRVENGFGDGAPAAKQSPRVRAVAATLGLAFGPTRAGRSPRSPVWSKAGI